MIATYEARVEGVAPLIMHNGELADPLRPVVEEIKAVAKKRNKTPADHALLAKLEWRGSLYLDDENRIMVPERMIEGVLRDGGKKNKLGKDTTRACWSEPALLEYEGPRDLDKLFITPGFQLRVGVVVSRQRVMRTRPRFAKWGLTAVINVDVNEMDPKLMKQAFENGCMTMGFGDWRPKYGRALVMGWTERKAK